VSLFLTGTDTGVGKTHTAVSLLRLARAAGLSCAGMKPICCGDRRDAELLLAAGSDGLTIDDVNPIWLKTPTAPFAASLIEDVRIDSRPLIAGLQALRERFEVVIVEGVGGWLVPIRQDYFVSDLAKEMGLPVVVVALNRLGCLNHTMLTVRSIAANGVTCAGVVLNNVQQSADMATTTNGDILSKLLDVPLLPELGLETRELAPEWRQILGG
jgi:dethiobiotin synthetase